MTHPSKEFIAFEWLRGLALNGNLHAGVALEEWARLAAIAAGKPPPSIVEEKIIQQIKILKVLTEQARDEPKAAITICPNCKGSDMNRIHHTGTFAIPECCYYICNECGAKTEPQ